MLEIEWAHVVSGLAGGSVVAVLVLGYIWIDDLVFRLRVDRSE